MQQISFSVVCLCRDDEEGQREYQTEGWEAVCSLKFLLVIMGSIVEVVEVVQVVE